MTRMTRARAQLDEPVNNNSTTTQPTQPHVYQCFNITQEATPDPFITQANGRFYLTFTGNSHIPLWEASSLIDFWDNPTRETIWYNLIFLLTFLRQY